MSPMDILVSEEDGESTLIWRRNSRNWAGTTIRDPRPEELTTERLADMMDLAAESHNAHDFVFTHRALAAVVASEFGSSVANHLMLLLTKFQGVPGITGVVGMGPFEDAESEFFNRYGVRIDGWHDWTIRDD